MTSVTTVLLIILNILTDCNVELNIIKFIDSFLLKSDY